MKPRLLLILLAALLGLVQPMGAASFVSPTSATTRGGGTLYLDATNGNDSTAVFGDASRPASTLSNAIALLPNNSTLIVRPGVYQARGKVATTWNDLYASDVKLVGKTNIAIIGTPGAVFHCTNDGILFGYQWCSNLLVSGITFRGTKTNSTTYDASAMIPWGMVQAYGTNTFVQFEKCRFETVNFFGLESGYGNNANNNAQTRQLVVKDSAFIECGHTNFSGAGTNPDGGAGAFHRDGQIINCWFEKCGRGIEWYGDPVGVESDYNALARDCTFVNNFTRDIMIVGPNMLGNGLIDNCTFIVDAASPRMASSPCIISRYHKQLTIANCTFTNLDSRVLPIQGAANAFGQSYNLTIKNNFFWNNANAIGGEYWENATITENTFDTISGNVIYYDGRDVKITDNHFQNCASGANAILMFNIASTNHLISRNKFVKDTGSAGTAFINIGGALLYNTRIVNNIFDDRLNSTPWIVDSGTATLVWNPVKSTFDTNDVFRVNGALSIGTNNSMFWTNSFYTNVTLDFPSTSSTFADLPVTWSLSAIGDMVTVSPPPGSITTINGAYSGFASNGAVYVRFQSGAATQDPASGSFRVWVNKFK